MSLTSDIFDLETHSNTCMWVYNTIFLSWHLVIVVIKGVSPFIQELSFIYSLPWKHVWLKGNITLHANKWELVPEKTSGCWKHTSINAGKVDIQSMMMVYMYVCIKAFAFAFRVWWSECSCIHWCWIRMPTRSQILQQWPRQTS